MLIRSQPGPSGWQLTDGTGKEELLAELAPLSRGDVDVPEMRRRHGVRAGLCPGCGAQLVARAAAAVDGVLTGPLSSEQLLAQPVAAGPANVGLNTPRLDVVTALDRAMV